MKRMLFSIGGAAGFILLGLLGMLTGCQGRFIYFPRPYPAERLPPGIEAISYQTGQGSQTAFWMPPPGGKPERIWVCFGGNAALALEWQEFATACEDRRSGFLFIDYPGYGFCKGSPTPGRILTSSEAAVGILLRRLQVEHPALRPELRVLGHSLGAACALQFAARQHVGRIVLVSPFTSAVDMGRRMVGWPLCHLVWHRFDNRARLREIARKPLPPRIIILHGASDEVVPVEMGRKLAGLFPGLVTYFEIPGADHNGIFTTAHSLIQRQMLDDR